MKKLIQLIFNINFNLTIIFMFVILSSGCSSKQEKIIIKKQYIYSKVPILKIYDNNSSLKLTAYNKDNKVCIKEWNSCLPKEKMIELINYTNSLKNTIIKYKNEVKIYNKYAKEHNSKIK